LIVLYGPSQAPFTEKVVRALALKGLAFELREPEGPEDYRRWNPETGLLPLIDIDGERVHDSTAILLRLDDLYPDPPLLSPEPRTRAAQRNLEHWVDESFFFYWLRWQRVLEEREAAGPKPAPPRGRVSSWLRGRGAAPTEERPSEGRRIGEGIGERLADLDRMLAGRPFFYSSRISMADLAVYAMLRSLASDSVPGGAERLASRPRLVAYMKRVAEATGG
jgi:glutathione S-transferase